MALNLRDKGYPASYTPQTPTSSKKGITVTTNGGGSSSGTSSKKTTTKSGGTSSTKASSTSTPTTGVLATSVPASTVVESYSGGASVDTSAQDEAKKKAQASAKAAMLSAYAAQNAYQNQLNALNSSISQRQGYLKSNYDSALSTLLSDYNLSKGNINTDAGNSLQQAYITNMLNQKNLKQKLASQGLSGGATESTVARLLNAYGNNRNSINNERSRNLSSLENSYNANRNSALSAYNSALAQLEADNYAQRSALQNALQDRLYSAISDYANSGAYDDDVYNQYVLGCGRYVGPVHFNLFSSSITKSSAFASIFSSSDFAFQSAAENESSSEQATSRSEVPFASKEAINLSIG